MVMGRIVAPFGVKGWVKVDPYTAAARNLLAYPVWWIGDGAAWQERKVGEARTQADGAKKRMLAEKERANQGAAEFKEAEAEERRGNSSYEKLAFRDAAEKFRAAEMLFVRAVKPTVSAPQASPPPAPPSPPPQKAEPPKQPTRRPLPPGF